MACVQKGHCRMSRFIVGDLVVVALSFLALHLLGVPFLLAMSAACVVLAAKAALRDVATTIRKGRR